MHCKCVILFTVECCNNITVEFEVELMLWVDMSVSVDGVSVCGMLYAQFDNVSISLNLVYSFQDII